LPDTEKPVAAPKKRLYALPQEYVEKLKKLARHSNTDPTTYLCELIDVEHVRKFYVSRYGGDD